MGKRALVCGISGQDGAYLARLLLDRGYEVWGSSRDAQRNSFDNLRTLGISDQVHLVSLNTANLTTIIDLLLHARPDEIYNLSGQSSVALSFELPFETLQSNSVATLNFLEGIKQTKKHIKLYNAGSTECFGDTGDEVANEESAFRPRSPYGFSKASAHWTIAAYRAAYGIHASTGILSNHESPFRAKRFVTRKIINAVATLESGKNAQLELGNLDVARDWGWAPEYVEAMHLVLQQEKPQDYIVATGESNTLTAFIQTAFQLINRDWREYTTLSPQFTRPTDIAVNHVSADLLRRELGWQAKLRMKDVIGRMLDAELALIRSQP